MTTWSEIFPDVDGPPVRGEPGDFHGVERAFAIMGDDAQDALDEFNKIKSDAGVSQLQGAAADAFERFVREVADSLGDLPRVCHEASLVFKRHADDLAALRQEVDSALARAQTKWNERNNLRTDVSNADQRVSTLQSQIDSLPSAGTDPGADSQRDGLDSDRSDAASNAQSLHVQLDSANAALTAIRREYDGFHERERTLRHHTHSGLDDIDLGDLKDPGRFASFCEGAFDFVMSVTGLDAIMDLVDAIVTGDWAKVLWKLREILDVVILVIAVVALFTPLGPIVLAVALGLAVAKLAVDVALYKTKWPNPETGEVISVTDLVMDGVGVALAGFGAFKPADMSLLQTGQRLAGLRGANIATRSSILRELGMTPIHAITSGRGWNLSTITEVKGVVKFTVLTGGKVVGAGLNAAKAPHVLTTPYQSPLSTDVFQSIADGHSNPESLPEKVKTYLLPNFAVTHTTCVPA
jgi:hypothetical protein